MEGSSGASVDGVCATDPGNPLHVAVTIHATWISPGPASPPGPAEHISADGGMGSVFLDAGVGAERRRIGHTSSGGDTTVLPYSDVGGKHGYVFAVSQKTATHYGDMVSHADTSDSLWTYDTHLVYSLHLPESGEYEAFFDGCCRWNELLNTPPEDYSKKAGWRIASHIRVSATSNALSFSPAIMSNFAQVQLKAQGPSGQPYPRSLVLTGADGAALASLVQGGVGGADISGRYTEIGAKLYVDTSVAVRDGGSRAAFLREDAAYSIVWFECPPGGELQFQYNRAYARRSGWAVVPGDARDALGRTPNPLAPGLPVLESLGGLWPEGAAYDAWRAQGPSYLPGAVSMEHDEAAAGAVRYSNTVQLHAYLPDDPLLAPFLPSAVFAATVRRVPTLRGSRRALRGTLSSSLASPLTPRRACWRSTPPRCSRGAAPRARATRMGATSRCVRSRCRWWWRRTRPAAPPSPPRPTSGSRS